MAKKPAPKITGNILCDFSFTPPTFWNGTIEFEEGKIYGITFVSLDEHVTPGQASHFEEEFIIYEFGNPANIYLKGWDAGVLILSNNHPFEPSQALGNGRIDEAYGPFEGWQGYTAHFHGLVYWTTDGAPERVEVQLRIN